MVKKSAAEIELYGAVYTKDWVVDLILDMVGYESHRSLVECFAVEPSAGEGAFALKMARRLLDSCRGEFDPTLLGNSLALYEIDETSAKILKSRLVALMQGYSISLEAAESLASSWVRVEDFLLADWRMDRRADFVIGNPPYIRPESLEPSLLEEYRDRYRTMIGRSDIYVAFLQASLSILNEAGVAGFICADRWMTNQYGASIRELITQLYSPITVIDMHRADAFETEVDAYPAIIIVGKDGKPRVVHGVATAELEVNPPRNLAQTLVDLRDGSLCLLSQKGLQLQVFQSWFQGKEPWVATSPEKLVTLRKLERHFLPLQCQESKTRVGIGVATGADELFIQQDCAVVEQARLLPLALSSDVNAEGLRWSQHYLINPWEGDRLVNLEQFPQLNAYFSSHETALKSRHVGKRSGLGWFRTIDKVDSKLLGQPKLFVPDIRSRLQPALDSGELYPSHGLYFIVSDVWDLRVLGGILLSDSVHFFTESYCLRMRGGYFRFQAQYLRKFRIPLPEDLTSDESDSLIEAFELRDHRLATKVCAVIYAR